MNAAPECSLLSVILTWNIHNSQSRKKNEQTKNYLIISLPKIKRGLFTFKFYWQKLKYLLTEKKMIDVNSYFALWTEWYITRWSLSPIEVQKIMTENRNNSRIPNYENEQKQNKNVCNEYLRYCTINKFQAVGTLSCTFHDNTLSMRHFFLSFIHSFVAFDSPQTLIISIVFGVNMFRVLNINFSYIQ